MGLEREVESFVNVSMVWSGLGVCTPRFGVVLFYQGHVGDWRRSGGKGGLIRARWKVVCGSLLARGGRRGVRAICTKVGVLVMGDEYGVGVRNISRIDWINKSWVREGLLGHGVPQETQ